MSYLGTTASDLLTAATDAISGKTSVKTQSDVKVDASSAVVTTASILGVAFVAGMFFLSRRAPRRKSRGRRRRKR